MMMNEQDAYVQSIYEQAMAKRSEKEIELLKQAKEEADKNFWAYLGKRLEHLIMAVMTMKGRPDITKEQREQAEKEVSHVMDIVSMYTLPEVIEQLTIDLAKKKRLEKLES